MSQEFEPQYHPKSEIGRVFFGEGNEKHNVDEVQDNEIGQEEEQDNQLKENWEEIDTGRTNATKFTEENQLMSQREAIQRAQYRAQIRAQQRAIAQRVSE